MQEDQALLPLLSSAAPWQLIGQFSQPPSSVTIYLPALLAGPSHVSSSLAPIPSSSLSLGSHQLSCVPAHSDFHNDEPMLPLAATFAPLPFIESVGFHSVIDLTVEDSLEDNEELQWGLTPFET